MSQDGSLVCIPSCSAGAFYNPSTLECVCPGNSYYEKGRCVQCKGSSQWDPSRKECVCLPDSKKDANGECQPCSPYARLDPVKNECVCLPGFQGDGNVCQRSLLLWLLILLPHHQRSVRQQGIPQRLLLLARSPLYLGRRCWDSMVVGCPHWLGASSPAEPQEWRTVWPAAGQARRACFLFDSRMLS